MPHSDIVARDPKRPRRRLGRWPVLLACGCGACGSAFGLPVLGGVRRTPATQVRASKHPLEEDLLELRLQAEENLGLPYLPEPGMLPAWAEPILVVPHKVQRDIEQLEYLVSKGRLDSEMENYVAEFALPEFRTALQLVSQALEGTADDSAVIDPNEHLAVFFGLHNRHLHLHPGTKLPRPVVNTELDLQEAQRSFAEQKHRAVVIDNFLSEHALQVLRDFLLESTIWTDVKRGYVGAYLQTGLASSLIVQVAEEIQRKLPDVLGGLRFQNAWAYMYDGELPGIGVHADDSQVQINIYVTPTEANMWTSDPSLPSGGLVIYGIGPPDGWDFTKYNSESRSPEIQEILEEAGYWNLTVPYIQNRAVLFDSTYLHRTDDLKFREGYANRRINLTFLYGSRDKLNPAPAVS